MGHRAVAARAGVPLAATTYYFSSLDDLVEAALRALAEGWLAAAAEVVDRLPPRLDGADALAAAVVDVVLGSVGEDAAVLTMYERYLQAGRDRALRPVVAEYGARLDALLLDVLRRGSAGADLAAVHRVLAVLDGTALRALAEGRPAAAAARAALTPAITG